MKPEVLRRRQEEMRQRQHAARQQERARQKRERERQQWELGRPERKRQAYALRDRSERYMKAQAKAMRLERYVTAFYGCKTSWQRVQEHGKYFTYYSRTGARRAERPEHGGNWSFKRQPLQAPLAGRN